MQCRICRNIHSPASTIPIPTFSFTSFSPPSPGSPPLPTMSFSCLFLSAAFFSHHLFHFMFRPSDPTFCLSPPMLLIHFLPFIEILSHQLHFSLCLSKDTKLQIKVGCFYLFLRKWKPGKINLILVFNTSSHLQL